MSVSTNDSSLPSARHDYRAEAWPVVLIDNRPRIRIFTRSYLDHPVTSADEVLAALPRTRSAPTSAKRYSGYVEHPGHPDGISTHSRTATTASVRSDQQNRRTIQRRRANLSRKQKQDAAKIEALRKEFTHIEVHSSDVSLGKFSEELSFAAPDLAILEYLQTAQGSIEGFDPREHCFMNSCGDVQMAHLKMYDMSVEDGPDFAAAGDPDRARRAMEAAVDWVVDMLIDDDLLPELDDLSLDEVRVDPHRSAGAHYRLQGFKKRGDVEHIARAEAESAVLRLLDGEAVAQRPTRIGGRGKPIKMSQMEAVARGLKKGRAIHMTDTRDHFILGLTEQPLNDKWKAKKYPISVGRGWTHGDATDFVTRFTGFRKIFCMDAEKFDSSLMPYLIHLAILVMRMAFVKGLEPEYDQYWHFVEESLLHSFVFRDDGVIFEKFLGTSSGHNHNSLAQSIVTLILGAFATFYLNEKATFQDVKDDFYMESLGDDNVTAHGRMLKDVTVDEVGELVFNVFKVSWLGDKSFATTAIAEGYVPDEEWDEENMAQTAQYLGKYFRKLTVDIGNKREEDVYIPYRPLYETAVRLLYPEGYKGAGLGDDSPDNYGDSRGGRVGGHMIDGYGNPLTRAWLTGLVEYCRVNHHECVVGYSEKLAKRYERLYAVDLQGEIKWDDFTFNQWLALIVVPKEERPTKRRKRQSQISFEINL